MIKRLIPRLDLCRKCPRFSLEPEKNNDGEVVLYKLFCEKEITAWEWKDPHRFDLNDQFWMPHDCNFKLEQVMLKGARRENGNSYATQL